jgi:hypothetical protein
MDATTTPLRGAACGATAAMAMTGLRAFSIHAGWIKEGPPARLVRKRARGLLRLAPRRKRGVVVELVHWVMGATFGALFGLLPERVRRRLWAGPLYGLAVWFGFELGAARPLGLTDGGWPKGRERAVFVVDHVLYGVLIR